MHQSGHGSQVAWDIAVDRVCGEQPKSCAVNSWAGGRSIGRSVIEVTVAIRIRARCDVVWRATAHVELRGKLGLERQLHVTHKKEEVAFLPIHPRRLTLLAVARLWTGCPCCAGVATVEASIGSDAALVHIDGRKAESLVIVLPQGQH